ncbi:hypothetical protein VTI74DRAFT_338 [Chaetomium olivicolor]
MRSGCKTNPRKRHGQKHQSKLEATPASARLAATRRIQSQPISTRPIRARVTISPPARHPIPQPHPAAVVPEINPKAESHGTRVQFSRPRTKQPPKQQFAHCAPPNLSGRQGAILEDINFDINTHNAPTRLCAEPSERQTPVQNPPERKTYQLGNKSYHSIRC